MSIIMEFGLKSTSSSSASVVNSAIAAGTSTKAITTSNSSSITSSTNKLLAITWEQPTTLNSLFLLANNNNNNKHYNNNNNKKNKKQGTTSSDEKRGGGGGDLDDDNNKNNAEFKKPSKNDSFVTSYTTTDSTVASLTGSTTKTNNKTNDELALISFNGNNSFKKTCTNPNVKSLHHENLSLPKALINSTMDHQQTRSVEGSSLDNFSKIINKIETMQLAEPIREFMKNFKTHDPLMQQCQQQNAKEVTIATMLPSSSLQLSLPSPSPLSSSSLAQLDNSSNYTAEIVVSAMVHSQKKTQDVSLKTKTDKNELSLSTMKLTTTKTKTKTTYNNNNNNNDNKNDKKSKNTTNNNKNSEVICLSSSLTATTTALATATSSIKVADNNKKVSTPNGSKGKENIIVAKGFQIPSDILDDLASRFIINVPDMELSNLIRICFQIELAHWFYLDFFCAVEESLKLQPCGMKQFTIQIFQHIPFLTHHLSTIDKILEDWKNYKLSVPTYGAILISEDLNYCLLVQSYFAKSSWGFPKGKVNETEDPIHCAAREVFEETGYDITGLIVPKDYIEAVINYQYTRLYIVCNVSLGTQFSPRTRNEIKCCDWFRIDALPTNKNDAISKAKLGLNANSFFMILPFVKRLKKWINQRRSKLTNGMNGTDAMIGCSPTIKNIALNSNSNGKSNKKNGKDDKFSSNNGDGSYFKDSQNSNSKRQRHKSMGDLDGMKILQNSNNNNNHNNISNSNINNNNNINSNDNKNASIQANSISSASDGNNVKRQLFHSQSHCGGYNQMMNSFDLSLKANSNDSGNHSNNNKNNSANKHNNNNNNNKPTDKRMRAQSDRLGSQTPNKQQQQQQQHQSNSVRNSKNYEMMKDNNNRNKNRSPKYLLQHQKSSHVMNEMKTRNPSSSRSSSDDSADDNTADSCFIATKPILNKNKLRRATTSLPLQSTPVYARTMETSTPPPALSELMSYHRQKKEKETKAVPFLKNTLSERQQQQQQHLLLGNAVNTTADHFNLHLETPNVQNIKQEYGMQTKLNNGIFQTKNSMVLQHLNQQNAQSPLAKEEQHETQQTTNFTPNIASWLNFTFTKNFISNVFL